MKRRTIGQLATELGIGVETIRFYERRGLIPQPVRAGGGYRHYGDDVAAMIRYIRLAQGLGLSLKDVERLKGYLDGGSTFCNVLRETARIRLDAVAQDILRLNQLKADLTAFLTRCEERDQNAPCPILVELGRIEAAVHKSLE
jgi:MerR family mercuric resistance operon transcriptional regulator